MEALIDVNKEVDLKGNTGKTKYMLIISHHQNAGQMFCMCVKLGL
jgi:hypothetical protein